QRGGDVVGQVADQTQARAALACELSPIECERIALVEPQSWLLRESSTQCADEVTVDLDRIEPPQQRQQRGGQSPLTGADLYSGIIGPKIHRGDDAADEHGVVQEM